MLRLSLGKRGGAALLATVALAVSASAAYADTPTEDQVSAGGVTGANSVMGGASRNDENGSHGVWALANDRGLQSMTGHTTCLVVDGNKATIGIQIDSSALDPANIGRYRELWVGDNGTPGNGVDYIYGTGFLDTAPTCDDPLPVANPRPIVFGDIQVIDATPPSL